MLIYSNSELTSKVSSEGTPLSYVLVSTHHSQHQTATMHSVNLQSSVYISILQQRVTYRCILNNFIELS